MEHKLKSKKVETVLNRLHVAEPVAWDNKARPAFAPEAALRRQGEKLKAKMEDGDDEEEETMVPKRKREREIELEEGDDYIIDLKKNFDLAIHDQKCDIVPET